MWHAEQKECKHYDKECEASAQKEDADRRAADWRFGIAIALVVLMFFAGMIITAEHPPLRAKGMITTEGYPMPLERPHSLPRQKKQ